MGKFKAFSPAQNISEELTENLFLEVASVYLGGGKKNLLRPFNCVCENCLVMVRSPTYIQQDDNNTHTY